MPTKRPPHPDPQVEASRNVLRAKQRRWYAERSSKQKEVSETGSHTASDQGATSALSPAGAGLMVSSASAVVLVPQGQRADTLTPEGPVLDSGGVQRSLADNLDAVMSVFDDTSPMPKECLAPLGRELGLSLDDLDATYGYEQSVEEIAEGLTDSPEQDEVLHVESDPEEEREKAEEQRKTKKRAQSDKPTAGTHVAGKSSCGKKPAGSSKAESIVGSKQSPSEKFLELSFEKQYHKVMHRIGVRNGARNSRADLVVDHKRGRYNISNEVAAQERYVANKCKAYDEPVPEELAESIAQNHGAQAVCSGYKRGNYSKSRANGAGASDVGSLEPSALKVPKPKPKTPLEQLIAVRGEKGGGMALG